MDISVENRAHIRRFPSTRHVFRALSTLVSSRLQGRVCRVYLQNPGCLIEEKRAQKSRFPSASRVFLAISTLVFSSCWVECAGFTGKMQAVHLRNSLGSRNLASKFQNFFLISSIFKTQARFNLLKMTFWIFG